MVFRKNAVASIRTFKLPPGCWRDLENVVEPLLSFLSISTPVKGKEFAREFLGFDAFTKSIDFHSELERVKGEEMEAFESWAEDNGITMKNIHQTLRTLLGEDKGMLWVERHRDRYLQFLLIGKEKGYVVRLDMAKGGPRGPYYRRRPCGGCGMG